MREFLATIDEETDRLNRLVGNLLDMSRIQTGALQPCFATSASRRSCPAALASSTAERAIGRDRSARDLPPRSGRRRAARTRRWPTSSTTRSPWSPAGARCGSKPREVGDHVEAAGRRSRPGHPARGPRRACSNRSNGWVTGSSGTGVGLGLAVATRDSCTRWAARFGVDDTPGGGTTMDRLARCPKARP